MRQVHLYAFAGKDVDAPCVLVDRGASNLPDDIEPEALPDIVSVARALDGRRTKTKDQTLAAKLAVLPLLTTFRCRERSYCVCVQRKKGVIIACVMAHYDIAFMTRLWGPFIELDITK